MREILSANLDSGADIGASVAVVLGGELVVDIWGGHTGPDRGRAWESDTIVNVWSTTKTMMTLSALMCVDRGLIDPDAPVATYWPEFAQNGKEGVLLICLATPQVYRAGISRSPSTTCTTGS